MKKIIVLLLVAFCWLKSSAQSDDLEKYVWYKYTYGTRIDRGAFDKVLRPPTDTIYTKTGLAIIGDTLYLGNGIRWVKQSGSGGGGSITGAGNLSPLFTTGVSGSTITFAQSNTTQYKILGRKASGSGSYSFLDADSSLIPGLHSEDYYNTKYVLDGWNGVTNTGGKVGLGGDIAFNTDINLLNRTLTFNGNGTGGKFYMTNLNQFYMNVDDGTIPQFVFRAYPSGVAAKFELSLTGTKEAGFYGLHPSYLDTIPMMVMHSGAVPSQVFPWGGATAIGVVPHKLFMNLSPVHQKNWTIESPNRTSDTAYKAIVWNPADSSVGVITYWPGGGGATTSLPISSLTPAISNNKIDNAAYKQRWEWDTFTDSAFTIYSNSASFTSGASLVNIHMDGVAETGESNSALNVTNSSLNDQDENIAIKASAINGQQNYAIIVPSGGGNVGIGTSTPDSKAILELNSITQGFLPPRMTSIERLAIVAVEGLLIYDTDSASLFQYNGSDWQNLYNAGGGGGSVNIYNTDGRLTSNRTLNGSGSWGLIMDSLNALEIRSFVGGQFAGILTAGDIGNNLYAINSTETRETHFFNNPLSAVMHASNNDDTTSVITVALRDITAETERFNIKSTLAGTSIGYVWTLTNTTTGEGEWAPGGSGGGITDVSTIDTETPNSDGATINGSNIGFQTYGVASTAFPGMVPPQESPEGKFLKDDGTWDDPAGSSPWTVSGSDIYYSGGKVGIGVTPTAELHISDGVGNLKFTTGANPQILSDKDLYIQVPVPKTIWMGTTSAIGVGITANQNLLLGGTNDPVATKVFCISNTTVAPSASIGDAVILYAEDVAGSSELKVRDEAGNITVLSPHNFYGIPMPEEDLSWSSYHEKDGKYVNVDMLLALRTIEELTKRVDDLEKKLNGKGKGTTKIVYKGKVK